MEYDADPLNPATLKGLGDRSYDKRKAAALEVTAVIKALSESNDKDKITSVINSLAQDFVRNKNVHQRKGGLIGLAAASIGLISDIDRYLHLLIPPVLEKFDDPENRVCYYACESMYNISKVARTSVLRYFNQIFDGLCKLFAHPEADVKNGANLLDRLIKDIVTETESFDVEAFIPVLQKHIKRTKPYIRQLVVSWITVLDAVPDINMLDYLPEFLDGLFSMLSDGNKEIQQAAATALAEFLKSIKEAEVVEFAPIVKILIQQCRSKDRDTRMTAILWVSDFIALGGTRLVSLYAGMLSSVMHCISDADPDIKQQTKTVNSSLASLVRCTTEPFDLSPILQTLTEELASDQVPSRVAALQWVYMLHEKDAVELNKFIGKLLPALLKAISDQAEDVVMINLQVLARISLDPVQFQLVLNALIQLFFEDRPLLESRGALVIRKLCALLEPRAIYMTIADILQDKNDFEFVSLVVQTLNLILLTAPELSPLRLILKDSCAAASPAADKEAFITLFKCWSHNPVSTFSLCLLAQAYDLSAGLVRSMASVEITVGFLMQIDKLVQLLESPIFIRLRLQLLEVNTESHSDLLKSLYGLLMLLPQSQAYKTLSDRLSTASSLHMHIGFTQAYTQHASAIALPSGSVATAGGKTLIQSAATVANTVTTGPAVDYDTLLRNFDSIQQKHANLKHAVLRDKSLINSSSNFDSLVIEPNPITAGVAI